MIEPLARNSSPMVTGLPQCALLAGEAKIGLGNVVANGVLDASMCV
jgi:hypothetical protein